MFFVCRICWICLLSSTTQRHLVASRQTMFWIWRHNIHNIRDPAKKISQGLQTLRLNPKLGSQSKYAYSARKIADLNCPKKPWGSGRLKNLAPGGQEGKVTDPETEIRQFRWITVLTAFLAHSGRFLGKVTLQRWLQQEVSMLDLKGGRSFSSGRAVE